MFIYLFISSYKKDYKVGVRLLGSRKVASDGYVIDFGDIKKATRKVCKQLNEHFLCPTLSNVLDIVVSGEEEKEENDSGASVTITCEDGSTFVFPKNDCAMLPIVHATAEELCVYLWSQILQGLNAEYMRARGIHTMEIIVAEAIGQEAVFRHEIPKEDLGDGSVLNVAEFVMKEKIEPVPCPSAPDNPTKPTTAKSQSDACCESCRQSFSHQLEQIASKLNSTDLSKYSKITVEDLQKIISS
jgi:6-pyruvoyltetrahydropterin/6-carboxytetrahydropterin synthase